jgi:putative ABC transport system permease protein
MPIAPGQMSYDPKTALVLWMDEEALASAFQLKGAFNNVSFQLEPGAQEAEVLRLVDAALESYGGRGALTRAKQVSNYVLEGELEQLKTMAGFVPYLFLFVAALLVNVVLSRLVQLQRSQIATLKAVGYPDLSIGLHYLELVTLIVGTGAILGVVVGSYLGELMTGMYTGTFFQFPDPSHRLRPGSVMLALSMSFGSALVGAWLSVSQVVRLPPAEAMRPPNPARYRRSLLEAVGLFGLLGPSARMVYRELARRPLRVALSVIGISFCTALVVVARASWDGVGYLLDVQFHESMREDLTVTLSGPMPRRVIGELGRIDGVLTAEGIRSVPVRFRAGSQYRDSLVMGYPAELTLRRLLDSHARPQQVPEEGIMLTDKLAEVLGVGVGDQVEVQFREGLWNTVRVPVTALVAEPFGLQGHMTARSLATLMRTEPAVNTVVLAVDPLALRDIERRLRGLPAVIGVSSPGDFRRQFNEQSASMILLFTGIITVFAAIIAIGVIYNNARVALSQRARDLASLRILGFTQREIATILFGEQAITVVAALPFGIWLGRWLSHAMMSTADPENYRFPTIMSDLTVILAVTVTVLSAIFSGLILRRKLYRLDLIAVLKTRE